MNEFFMWLAMGSQRPLLVSIEVKGWGKRPFRNHYSGTMNIYTLKNQEYHFEHNFGHGHKHLSVVFAFLMMLTFAVDQAQQLSCQLFQAAWAKAGSKRALWEKLRGLFNDLPMDSSHCFWLSSRASDYL